MSNSNVKTNSSSSGISNVTINDKIFGLCSASINNFVAKANDLDISSLSKDERIRESLAHSDCYSPILRVDGVVMKDDASGNGTPVGDKSVLKKLHSAVREKHDKATMQRVLNRDLCRRGRYDIVGTTEEINLMDDGVLIDQKTDSSKMYFGHLCCSSIKYLIKHPIIPYNNKVILGTTSENLRGVECDVLYGIIKWFDEPKDSVVGRIIYKTMHVEFTKKYVKATGTTTSYEVQDIIDVGPDLDKSKDHGNDGPNDPRIIDIPDLDVPQGPDFEDDGPDF